MIGGSNVNEEKKEVKKPASQGGPRITKLASAIRDNIGKLYSGTYFSHPTNSQDLVAIKKDILASINSISANTINNTGQANITALYSRIKNLNGDANLARELADMFSDKSAVDDVMSIYMENKYLKDLDNQIDAICKYMPKLEEALDTRKDNVLSADHFSKDFISIANTTTINNATFAERIKNLKTKYHLLDESEKWYENTAKYGEQFLYCVPYKRALARLLQNRDSNNVIGGSTQYRSVAIGESAGRVTIRENFSLNSSNISHLNAISGINIEFSTSGIIEDQIIETYRAFNKLTALRESSLCLEYSRIIESVYTEAKKKDIGMPDLEMKKGKDREEEYRGTSVKNKPLISDGDLNFDSYSAQDGFIGSRKKSTGDNDIDEKNELNVPGCIIKKLDRSLIKPIYIEDVCLGYYYIELKNQEKDAFFDSMGSVSDVNTMNFSKLRASRSLFGGEDDNTQSKMLKNMALQISQYIDAKFINSNIDISKEIYMILKYNEDNNFSSIQNMKITYIPPEDIIHIKFREDPVTHRGISDLQRALFPATIYSELYLANAIAQLTRSFDKRVYYVKQTIDTNIAKTLLTTINQIKKSNFNLRQMSNINNIFNLTGAMTDFLVPTNGGDPPISMEVMQGQQVNMPTELMDSLEEMAVNSTDVPIELIQARQSMDYAVQYTMTNSKFLRKVYHRQGQYQRFLSHIITKIYNYEYNENVQLEVQLPPPIFLNISNTAQIMTNTADLAAGVVELRMANEPNESVRNIFGKKVKEYYLGSYLDQAMLDKMETEARQEASLIPNE